MKYKISTDSYPCVYHVVYISNATKGTVGIWNIYTNNWFSSSFLSETPPDPPGLWSIPWEVPKRVLLTKLCCSREERRFSSSGYLYVQEDAMFFIFTPCFYIYSLCQRQLAHILYESCLHGVFHVYTTLKPRSSEVCSAYVLQTFSDLNSRVVYTWKTPHNHDLYFTYIAIAELTNYCLGGAPAALCIPNGSNHWILRRLTRSTKLICGQGTEVLLAATSDRLPSHPAKMLESHRQLFRPYWGSSVWRTDG